MAMMVTVMILMMGTLVVTTAFVVDVYFDEHGSVVDIIGK